jgi:DNA-binding CsgD family transcriptional regulator
MEASSLSSHLGVLDRQISQRQASGKPVTVQPQKPQLAIELIEECLDGILVFTDEKQLLYANDGAHKILSQLRQDEASSSRIPEEIWHICQALIQSRHQFPDQNWLIEFDIFTHDAKILHICSRWLKLETMEHPCLLLTIEDRQQAILNIVMEEVRKYGLTPREKEVWLMHRNTSTYKQIATELGITPNTVKKHMRSIYAKQKACLETATEA